MLLKKNHMIKNNHYFSLIKRQKANGYMLSDQCSSWPNINRWFSSSSVKSINIKDKRIHYSAYSSLLKKKKKGNLSHTVSVTLFLKSSNAFKFTKSTHFDVLHSTCKMMIIIIIEMSINNQT